MKKVISVLLSVLLLVSALSLTAFAATEETVAYGNEDGTAVTIEYSKDKYPSEWVNGVNYVIKSGCTFVVPSGRVLNVPYNSTLTVEEGAHLVLNGQLNAVDTVDIYGKLTGTNVTGQENVNCYVTFPDLTSANINLGDKIDVCYYLSNTNDSYGDVGVELEKYLPVADTGDTIAVKYNTYLYVRILIAEKGDEDKYDDKLFPVKCNGVVVPFNQNACPILVTTGSEIGYASWVNDSTYYNTYTISLPKLDSTGYTVYGRNGEVEDVVVKYGQAFSFRVELEEDYNQSAYEVYVFNGTGWTDLEKEDLIDGIAPAIPDSEGYYTISNVTNNYSVYVQGVISNQMLGIFEQIFTIFRQIWEAIIEIFNGLFGEGGLDGLLGGLA